MSWIIQVYVGERVCILAHAQQNVILSIASPKDISYFPLEPSKIHIGRCSRQTIWVGPSHLHFEPSLELLTQSPLLKKNKTM